MGSEMTNRERDQQLERLARGRQSNAFFELASLAMRRKKYWLLPVIVVLLLFGMLVVLGGTAAAPLIYSIF